MCRGQVLTAVLIGSACQLALIPLAGAFRTGSTVAWSMPIAAIGGAIWSVVFFAIGGRHSRCCSSVS